MVADICIKNDAAPIRDGTLAAYNFAVAAVLQPSHARITSIQREQLGVRTPLDDLALVSAMCLSRSAGSQGRSWAHRLQ
jgi:hypothetical protein